MKRILIFSVAYIPFIGGAEIAVKELTDRLGEYEFDMITLNLDQKQLPQEKIGNITVYRIGNESFISKLFFPFHASWLAGRLHKNNPYDATWSIMASFSGFAALVFKLFHKNVPYLLSLQEGDPLEKILRQVRFVKPFFKMIFTKADRIQVISNFLATFAKDMGARAPIDVVSNGVDISLFTQTFTEDEKSDLKHSLLIRDDQTVLITTSRLIEKNGVADVIKALKLLPKNVVFLVLGTGPLEQSLKNLVVQEGLNERVLFRGLIKYKDIPRYLSIADIFIRPSLSEGMGNSFIEAMAAGVPVIATAVGGIPDFVVEGKTGMYVAVSDPSSIAKTVTTLMTDADLRQTLIREGRELATHHYDWQIISDELKNRCLEPLFD